MDGARIFLSSTYSDLAEYREAVQKLVHQSGDRFIGMEHFGARSQPPLATCLESVAASDVVIVVVGARYGLLSDDGRSFTHREALYAHDLGIPILAFLHEDPGAIPSDEAAGRAQFIEWISQEYTWVTFNDAESLVRSVAAALRREQARPRHPKRVDAWHEIVARAGVPADWECVTLSAHNVDRLYSVDLVAPDYETGVGAPTVVAGGSGANTAAGLGRLGVRVAAAGLVADDEDGALVRRSLVDAGVEPLMAPADGLRYPTGTAMVFSDQRGRRSIYVNPGANERFASAVKGAYRAQLRCAVRSARIVHFSSFTLAPERRLQETLLGDLSPSALLSLKPGALYCKLGLDRLAPLLQRTNILFLDEQQLDALLGIDSPISESMPLSDKIERLYNWKRTKRHDEALALVINTPSSTAANGTRQLCGAAGRTELEVMEPMHASNGLEVVMRDSTGTGDAAAAGLLWAALQGKPLHCAIDVAYVLSQSASREYGGRAGLPSVRQLRWRWTRWVASPYQL